MISARGAFRSYARWQNAILRNNLFLGTSGYAVETGSPHPATSLDYNGYRQAEPERFIKWYDGVGNKRYPDLSAFFYGTGFEKNGIMIDFDIFINAVAPLEGTTYDYNYGDLFLKTGSSPVDTGILLSNINDDYTGSAPDIGCYELGQSKSHYGPRDTP